MAKLVEILAKELVEWPEVAEVIVQDADNDSTCWSVTSLDAYLGVGDYWELPDDAGGYFDIAISRPSQLATDHATAIVTREMWQAERDKTASYVGVDEAKAYLDASVKWVGELTDPRAIRDRIREIDANIEAMTAERAELVSKLAGEGFALIGRINDLLTEAAQKHEDMSDWRNWKVGDLVEMIRAKSWADMTNGKLYKIIKAGENGFSFADDVSEVRECSERTAPDYAKDFKWHSRPSA